MGSETADCLVAWISIYASGSALPSARAHFCCGSLGSSILQVRRLKPDSKLSRFKSAEEQHL